MAGVVAKSKTTMEEAGNALDVSLAGGGGWADETERSEKPESRSAPINRNIRFCTAVSAADADADTATKLQCNAVALYNIASAR